MKLGYERIVNDIHPFYLQAAEKSMNKAASNVITKTVQANDNTVSSGPTDIIASFDGSSQRHGYASLNGIVSCIERVTKK